MTIATRPCPFCARTVRWGVRAFRHNCPHGEACLDAGKGVPTCGDCKLAVLYVSFHDLAIKRCGMQCQYASAYVGEYLRKIGSPRVGQSPDLGAGLRFDLFGTLGGNHHAIRIHRDDADEFVRRLREYQTGIGAGWRGEPLAPESSP